MMTDTYLLDGIPITQPLFGLYIYKEGAVYFYAQPTEKTIALIKELCYQEAKKNDE